MTLSTICGVYPFNLDAIDCSISVGNSEKDSDDEKVLENARQKNSEDH